MVVEFDHLAAAFADCEGDDAVAVAILAGMGAGNEGVDAFEPMHDAIFEQLFQRPVDLQRRTKTLVAQLVEDRIGAEGPSAFSSTSKTSDWLRVS